MCTHNRRPMPTIKVGVREFREQIARFLESDTPVAVTRRGETLGVYVPTPRKSVKSADMTELRAAAERLPPAEMIVLDANILIRAVLGKRVRQLLETYAVHGIRFYAPEVAY